jgi:hypothetical protein
MTRTRFSLTSSLRPIVTVSSAIAAGAIICVAVSCGPTGQERYEQRLANTGAPALHAVQSDRLREIMDKLNYSMTLDPPDRITEPPQRARQLARVAKDMAAKARAIPGAVTGIDLAPQSRDLFMKLADKLAAEADGITEAADRLDYDGVHSHIEHMQSTCNACHSLFRSQPGMK